MTYIGYSNYWKFRMTNKIESKLKKKTEEKVFGDKSQC